MFQKNNGEWIFMPSLNMVLITGDNNALSKGKSSCLMGMSGRCFLEFNINDTKKVYRKLKSFNLVY